MGKSIKYPTVVPYLILPDAAGFLKFTTHVFNAEELMKMMHDSGTIQHAEIQIGDSVIMVADQTEKFAAQPASLTIHLADIDETFKRALDAGAKVVMELGDQQYGRSGGVKDPFGNTWWLMSRR